MFSNDDFQRIMIFSVALMGIGYVCAVTATGHFSGKIFLSCISIGMVVLVIIPVIPYYMVLFSIICTAMLFFSDGDIG